MALRRVILIAVLATFLSVMATTIFTLLFPRIARAGHPPTLRVGLFIFINMLSIVLLNWLLRKSQ
jgi:hypothetical protein